MDCLPSKDGFMPILTEAQLRERVRQPQDGMKLLLPRGTIFSPSAADFIKQWHIDVTYEELSSATPAPAPDRPEWDKDSVFPVNLKGELPHCITCGTPLNKKPEHMTQLNAEVFAPKTNDRIRLRGKLDTLQALCLLVGSAARDQEAAATADLLETLAAYCREMMSAEYNERPVQPLSIGGLDEAQLRKTTHEPQEALGIPHLTPNTQDSPLLLWLNYLRCQARETELTAIACFGGEAMGRDVYGLVQAMNRMSSAIYYLELLLKRA
jgi:ethanolamine utilization cobalamin adenosyltransferase